MSILNPRALLTTGALAVGVALGAAGIASAASNGSPAASGSTAPAAAHGAPSGNPANLTHGPGETLLTGTTAAKVKAAALAAVPGASVIRIETDSGGAAYEAHLHKSDGSIVTVKVARDFTVTATQSGFGSGPAGGGMPAPGGAPSA